MGLERVAVLIPARAPERQLQPLVQRLGDAGFGKILVVDDGSGPDFEPLFAAVARLPKVTLLRHAVNLGKGRALKTGINHFLNDAGGCSGLLTCDADGQHAPEDIVRVAEQFVQNEKTVVLGARTFAKDVPLRSRFGNELTRKIFGFVTGKPLTDTQTGLRVFPREMLPELLLLDGERYEYEMTALLHVCRFQQPVEVPIATIYLEGNRSSHFDPIRDSMRIYFVLFRFYLSAVIAAGIDWAGFTAAFWATGSVGVSVAIGRLSSLVNFSLNKKYVFNSRVGVGGAIVRYYLLAAAIGGASYCSIVGLRYFGWNVFAGKLVADSLLSLVSFSVQRTFVFREREGR
jgi:glycosyltransferase involved in cell wall biosynthesis